MGFRGQLQSLGTLDDNAAMLQMIVDGFKLRDKILPSPHKTRLDVIPQKYSFIRGW